MRRSSAQNARSTVRVAVAILVTGLQERPSCHGVTLSRCGTVVYGVIGVTYTAPKLFCRERAGERRPHVEPLLRFNDRL